MKRKKKLLVLTALCMWTASLWAQETGDNASEESVTNETNYDYLVFTTSDGNLLSLTVSELEMTFSNGSLTAVNTDGTYTLTLSEIASMQFSTTQEGTLPDAIRCVSQPVMADAVEMFTLSGISLGVFSNVAAAEASLPRGVYVGKQQGSTFKLSVK